MGHLSIEEVHRIAALAKLRLSDQEAARVHSDLEAILKHVDALQAVDVTDIEPMASPLEHVNRIRADEPSGGLPRTTVLDLAPATEGDFITVPRVLEGDGA
jgi:aspartyl-tRNA(Asn)/glutamyl-tRNA(Gln) amidotransferase subunit C